MKRYNYWGMAALIVVLIFGATYWGATLEERGDPLNKADAFVYSDSGELYWFDVKSRNGKIEGHLHKQKLVGESSIEQHTYTMTGKTTEKGYQWQVKNGAEITTFEAWFSGPHLSVQKEGEKDIHLYNPVTEKQLEGYVEALKDYHSEEKEKNRIRKFFTELRSVYGYLYTAEDRSFQLFVKIDEALLQGELSGSLLMMNHTGNGKDSYEETKYALNGITDGHIVRLYTTVDGKKTKLNGTFYEDASGFDLSFWKTERKLSFHSVSEEEFKRSHDEFQRGAQ